MYKLTEEDKIKIKDIYNKLLTKDEPNFTKLENGEIDFTEMKSILSPIEICLTITNVYAYALKLIHKDNMECTMQDIVDRYGYEEVKKTKLYCVVRQKNRPDRAYDVDTLEDAFYTGMLIKMKMNTHMQLKKHNMLKYY